MDQVLNIALAGTGKTANIWHSRDNAKFAYGDIPASTPSGELSAMLHAINLEPGIDPSTLITVTYLVEKDLSQVASADIAATDIKAVIIYFDKGRRMGVKVFQPEHGVYHELAGLASETDAVASNHAHLLAQYYADSNTRFLTSFVYSDNDKLTGKTGTDHFVYKLDKLVNRSKPRYRPTTGVYHTEHMGDYNNIDCKPPCFQGGSLPCAKRPTYQCKGIGDCGRKSLQPWNTYADDEDPRDPVLYNFRDNILAKSALGEHFIYDYYYISTVIKDNLNATIAAESFTILDNIVVPALLKILHTPESTALLIHNTEKAALLVYIAHVRSLSDDPLFLEMMDEIVDNIVAVSSMTVNQVYNQFTTE